MKQQVEATLRPEMKQFNSFTHPTSGNENIIGCASKKAKKEQHISSMGIVEKSQSLPNP